LCLQTPATGEAFYMAASEPSNAESGVVDFKRLGELAHVYPAIEIVGPPPLPE
jgi:hypothetical protein